MLATATSAALAPASQPRFRIPNLLYWLDDHILLVLAAFLMLFIPLYPKIPVWSPIEQYIVRVRLEDFGILFAMSVWGIQVLRKRAKWRAPIVWWMLAYVVVGALSTLASIFITKQIPLQPLHIEKTVLHNLRYIEYFSLFLIFFAAVKKRRDAVILLVLLAAAVLGITIYGFGQKYYYWPVYSTMNREFSKGIRLVLTDHARVQSTFAGHYDMAAYLVITLPILLAMAYLVKNKRLSMVLHLIFWGGTWLLMVSASRASFIAYLVGAGLVLLFVALQKNTWVQRFRFAISRGVVLMFFASVLFLYFGVDLADRFNQIIDSNQQLHDTFHTLNKDRKDFWDKYIAHTAEQVAPILPPKATPTDAITTDQAVQLGIISPTDERPVPAAAKPADVYVNVPDIQQVATKAADGSTQIISVDKGPRTYSNNALVYGLSSAIRLDTLWPNAIRGFQTDPLFGRGYATLNKASVEQFTEAESTDNNFLRVLGETGALGFATFFGTIVVLMIACVKAYRTGDNLSKMMAIGMFGASVGLLLNAIFIDVYASSKVAESYWALAGLFYSYVMLGRKKASV